MVLFSRIQSLCEITIEDAEKQDLYSCTTEFAPQGGPPGTTLIYIHKLVNTIFNGWAFGKLQGLYLFILLPRYGLHLVTMFQTLKLLQYFIAF